MSLSRFSVLLLLIAMLLAGCATPSTHDATDPKPYIDPATGVAFPKHAALLDRVALNPADSDTPPVSAHYTGSGIDAGIRLLPSSQASPDQLISQTFRSLNNHPGFAQTDYHGARAFNGQPAYRAQCTYSSPTTGTRSILKIVILPRSNFLVCFTFVIPPADESSAQSTIESFIRAILTASKKEVLMTPANAASEDQSDSN